MKQFVLFSIFSFFSFNGKAQWIPCSPIKDYIFTLAEKNGKLYAGTYGGLYESTDDGINWKNLQNTSPPNLFTATHNGIVKLWTDSSFTFALSLEGKIGYQTVDNLKWEKLISYPYELVYGSKKGLIFRDFSNLYFTKDKGITKKNISNTLPISYIVNTNTPIQIYGNKIIYIQNGLAFVSEDEGDHWNTLGLSGQALDVSVQQQRLYITTPNSIWVSMDSLKSFSSVAVPEKPITLSAKDSSWYFLSASGIWASSNSGKSWTKSSSYNDVLFPMSEYCNYFNSPFKDILILSSKGTLLASAPKGLIRSTDKGKTWKYVNTEPFKESGSIQLLNLKSKIHGSFKKTYPIVGGPPLIFISSDNGQNWTTPSPFFQYFYKTINTQNYNLLYSYYDNILYSSIDTCKTWVQATIQNTDLKAINFLVSDEQKQVAALEHHGKIWYSSDEGITWKTLNQQPLQNENLENIAMTKDGIWVYSRTALYFTSDTGATWRKVYAPLKQNEEIYRLFIVPSGIIVDCKSSIYYSINKGLAWENIKYNISGINAIVEYNNKLIASPLEGRVQLLHNDEWKEIDDISSPNYKVFYTYDLLIKDDTLFSANNYGVYKRSLKEILITNSKEIPTSTSSIAFFPNPVTDKIYFKEKDWSSIAVYDLLGKVVLTSETATDNIDVSYLKSGVYFLVIEKENKRSTYRFLKHCNE